MLNKGSRDSLPSEILLLGRIRGERRRGNIMQVQSALASRSGYVFIFTCRYSVSICLVNILYRVANRKKSNEGSFMIIADHIAFRAPG